jgi:polygalacturonase
VWRRTACYNWYADDNDDLDGRNEHIVISGGAWDGNNAKNPRRPMPRNRENPRTFFTGSTMLLMHVNHLLIEKATIKDPEKFGINIGACHKFTVDNIVFDYNALRGNMDGVHVHGGSSEGKITNLMGNTYDDMVAITTEDREYEQITQGPISDIQVDGLWSTNCFRAVRFLSSESAIRRISISNVYGSYYRNAVAFTHWILPVKETSVIEDITINNIFCAKVTEPELVGKLDREDERRRFAAIIDCEGLLSIDNISVSNVVRREWMPDAGPTIRIQRGAKIGTLRLYDIQHVNKTDRPLVFFRNDASIFRLFTDGVVIRDSKIEPLTGEGKILNRHGEFIIENGQEIINESKRVDEDVKNRPVEEQRL